tara:strand:- start:1028 stop:4786 length:3759 start_codon:yes stop_codon:yes gene_type:complete
MALTKVTGHVVKTDTNVHTHNINSSGIVTSIGLDINGNADISGNLGVGGTLTYQDVTNVDSVGIITARAGIIDSTLTSGRVTYAGSSGRLTDSANLTFDGNTLALDSNTGTINVSRNSRTLTLEGNYGNEGHPAVKTSTGHDLRIFTNGNNERLRIMSGGAIGIHTTTGSNTVNIGGAAGLGVKFHNFTSGNSSYVTIESGDKLQSNVGGTGYYTWVTGGAEKMRLANNGRLGIGTNNPSSGKLQVQDGGIAVKGASTPNINFAPGSGGSGNADISFDAIDLKIISNSSSSNIRIAAYSKLDHIVVKPNGNIGIRTDNPESADSLQVFGATTPMLTIKAGATGSDTNRRASLRLWTNGNKLYKLEADASDGGLKIYDSSTERIHITSAGRVGINQTSPQQQLHVSTSTDYQGIFVNGNSAPTLGFGAGSATTPSFKIGIPGTNNTWFGISTGTGNANKFTMDGNGKSGFTHNPDTEALTVGGGQRWTYQSNNWATGTEGAFIDYYAGGSMVRLGHVNGTSGSAKHIVFYSGGGEKLRIMSGGDVGISSNAPRAKLDVKDQGTSKDVILRVSADNNTPYALVVGNDDFNTTSNRGLAMWVGSNKVHHISARTSTTASENELKISATDAIYFGTGSSGTEALRITSTGNIGINDGNPAALFTVNNGTTDSQFVQMKNDNVGLFFGAYGTGHGSYPREATINGSRIDSGSSPFLRIAGQGGIKFCVDLNTERLRITSAGRVVINKTSGDYDGALHVAAMSDNAITIEGANAAINWRYTDGSAGYRGGIKWHSNGLVKFDAGVSGNAYYYQFDLNGSEKLRITSSGRIDIKGDSGNDGFTLSNAYGQAGFFGGMYYNGSSWVRNAHGGRLGAGVVVYTGGHVAFLTSPENSGTTATMSERMRLSNSGTLSIGGLVPNISAAHGLEISNAATTEIRLKNTSGGTGSGDGFAIQKWSNGNTYLWEYDAQDLLIGTSNGERIRVDSGGNVGVGNWGTTNIPQPLSVLGNIYQRQGDIITWNNGDCQIGGISGYHFVISTYNGSSMLERMRVTSGGTVQVKNHLTSQNGIVQINQVTSTTRFSGSIASVDLITGSAFTPRTSAPRFLIMIFCPVNSSDDSDAGNMNTNPYHYGRIEYQKNGGSWLECDNQGSTSEQGGSAAHIELSPNRTGDQLSGWYLTGHRYRMEHKSATVLVTNVGDVGAGGWVKFKLRGYSQGSGGNTFSQIGQPHGNSTDDNYPVQPWGFTVFELAPDSNSYTVY